MFPISILETDGPSAQVIIYKSDMGWAAPISIQFVFQQNEPCPISPLYPPQVNPNGVTLPTLNGCFKLVY